MQLTPHLSLDTTQQQLYDAVADTAIELSFAETAVLALLIEQHEQVVTKEQMLATGWPGRIVSDSSIQQCISVLRKKLCNYPDITLKTIPRHGYVLHLPRTKSRPKYKTGTNVQWLLLVLLIMGSVLWYFTYSHQSDFPYQEHSLVTTISNTGGDINLLTPSNSAGLDNHQVNTRLHQQIVDEPHWQPPFDYFMGFAQLRSQTDSIAICPDYRQTQCHSDKLINITGLPQQPGELRLSDFFATKIRMEQKTYNNLVLPELDNYQGELIEQLYHGDLYFSQHNARLVRGDLRISLVDLTAHSGIFYFAACITDEDCYSDPTRYVFKGQFQRTTEKWQQRKVERFSVTIESSDLASPKKLSKTAQIIYLKLRKQRLTENEITFYRIYQDDGSAVWQIPVLNDSLVWMMRKNLKL
ncbi:transcriptional regulator [Shewanella waksmanii]|uniref:winged helix-turn-helix domain-containing protein n=1 Tax=Shewanella waksmanii TaxID=213783 RepID=UPI00373607F8